MKKLILIPSLAIASTLPALTVVSCSKQKIGEGRQSDGEFKGVHDTPTFSVSAEEATNEYFKRANQDVFADDIVKSMADSIMDPAYSKYFKNGKISVKFNEINKENCHCSFTIHESGYMEIGKTNEFEHADLTTTVIDVPMLLSYNHYFACGTNSIKGVSLNIDSEKNGYALDDLYKEYETWSFAVNGKWLDTEFNDVINHENLDDIQDEKHQKTLSVLKTNFISSFFKNVTVQEG